MHAMTGKSGTLTSTESCLAKHGRDHARTGLVFALLCCLISLLSRAPDPPPPALLRTLTRHHHRSSYRRWPACFSYSVHRNRKLAVGLPRLQPEPDTRHRTSHTVHRPASTGTNGLGDDCPPPDKSASASHRIPASRTSAPRTASIALRRPAGTPPTHPAQLSARCPRQHLRRASHTEPRSSLHPLPHLPRDTDQSDSHRACAADHPPRSVRHSPPPRAHRQPSPRCLVLNLTGAELGQHHL